MSSKVNLEKIVPIILVGITTLETVTRTLSLVKTLIERSSAEDRDLTTDEVNIIVSAMNDADANWLKRLES